MTTMPAPRHFMLRLTRLGPLVPARLWWCDYEPGVPENKLDRPPFPRADVAGTEVDPEILFDRLYADTAERPAIAASHWKYARPVSVADYDHERAVITWAEEHRRDDPRLTPRAKVNARQFPLPDFSREREVVK